MTINFNILYEKTYQIFITLKLKLNKIGKAGEI